MSIAEILKVGGEKDLFESVEFFTVEFVEFGVDVYKTGEQVVEWEGRWMGAIIHLMVFSVRGMMTCSLQVIKSVASRELRQILHCID